MNPLKRLFRKEARAFLGIVPPRPAAITTVGTARETTVLRYTFQLPPEPKIDDLDHREVTTIVDSTESVASIPKGQATFTHDFERNVPVTMVLTDVDTAGNKSQPSNPLTFTTADTVAPPQPGEFGILGVEQV